MHVRISNDASTTDIQLMLGVYWSDSVIYSNHGEIVNKLDESFKDRHALPDRVGTNWIPCPSPNGQNQLSPNPTPSTNRDFFK